MAWEEVAEALASGRRELVLFGPEVGSRLTRDGRLPPELFELRELNLLRVSGVGLVGAHVPPELARLRRLRELLLFGNALVASPPEVVHLRELRVLDLSDNRLTELPAELGGLPHLAVLNVRGNQLADFPSLAGMKELREIDASRNRLVVFPDVCRADNERLADLLLASNLVERIPAEVALLPALKNLDLGDNRLKTVPREVAEVSKLKEINLKGNNLSDNRLRKLVDQCRTKQIVDYLRQNCPKGGETDDAPNKKNKKTNKKGGGSKRGEDAAEADSAAAETLGDRMYVLRSEDDFPDVKTDDRVKTVRSHIVCCAVVGLSFNEDTFKKFIQMQTKLHDTVCEKRNAATIATHDMAKLPPGNLTYTARPPHALVIRPLTREKTYSGLELYNRLRKEAEDLRKEKKRNVFSGIHKYLYLLEGKSLYPCLEDSEGNVISFPPITNSELTKMSIETTTMLVEVTSAQNQTICRKVMDQFLRETLNMGVGGSVNGDEVNNRLGTYHQLKVQQMKIVDLEGKMRVIYPSKVDLFYEDEKSALKIIRD